MTGPTGSHGDHDDDRGGGHDGEGDGAAGAVPWRAVVDEAARRLAGAGFATPAVDARRLVEAATGCEGAAGLEVLDRPATRRALAAFDGMLARRLTGEPLQYVLGGWAFRTLDLFVDGRVLIPRPETEVVAGRALAELDRRRAGPRPPGRAGRLRAADLGTGSGAIALALVAERPDVEVWATDVSGPALEVARANLAGVGSASARVRLAEGSWFSALPGGLRGHLDLVVSNPPYVAAHEELPAEVRDWEPPGALVAGPTGLEALAELVDEARAWLAPGGSLVVELAPHQAAAVRDRALGAGYAQVEVGADLVGRERLIAARTADPAPVG